MGAENGTTPACALGPEMSIVQAAEHHERLLQALPALMDDPRLDMSRVTEFDSSGIQLLLALRASLSSQGKTLTLVQPSPVVREALAVFGLQDALPTAAATPTH